MSDKSHAAMCVYCGEAVIYDTREISDMETAHQKIVEHDQSCPSNPLVQRVAELEETARLAERFARAKGRHHSQQAACDLMEHFGLPCVRPG
ncbi:hypothetical protein [Halomonas caseinilytica]|uniref:hypothetical protein n=1 Tax=Halomonas caseinilytica TaxID=438744 RepID=UPI0008492703|nr:hypothetical protein [Halomonas caseinilytica]